VPAEGQRPSAGGRRDACGHCLMAPALLRSTPALTVTKRPPGGADGRWPGGTACLVPGRVLMTSDTTEGRCPSAGERCYACGRRFMAPTPRRSTPALTYTKRPPSGADGRWPGGTACLVPGPVPMTSDTTEGRCPSAGGRTAVGGPRFMAPPLLRSNPAPTSTKRPPGGADGRWPGGTSCLVPGPVLMTTGETQGWCKYACGRCQIVDLHLMAPLLPPLHRALTSTNRPPDEADGRRPNGTACLVPGPVPPPTPQHALDRRPPLRNHLT
jgi:hypothetical protein